MYSWDFDAAICVVLCIRWQCVLSLLAGNVCFGAFYVALCFIGYFKWQCVLLGLLRGNMCCCMFLVAM